MPSRPARLTPRYLWPATLALWAAPVAAQSPPAPPVAPAGPPAAETTQRVEVTASGVNAAALRREANALLTVLNAEDLLRQGDTQLADVLRRVPGVSVTGGQGRAADIRLRGLGNGYTQFLVNGEPVAPGFSIDSLSPALIERVEVRRSATADQSTQAIAGSINVILKRSVPAQGERELKLGASQAGAAGGLNASYLWGEREGQHSRSMAVQLSRERHLWPSSNEVLATTPSGTLLSHRDTVSDERGLTQQVGWTPRWSWKPDETHTLSLDGLLHTQRMDFLGQEDRSARAGAAAPFAHATLTARNQQHQAQANLQWKAPLPGSEGRLELKAGGALQARTIAALLQASDLAEQPLLRRDIDSALRDLSAHLSGKLSLPLGDAHTLGLGWDGQLTSRRENRLQAETSPVPGYPTLDLDEAYRAKVQRLALYAQDEWAVQDGLSAYLGLRWESLQTRTEGNVLSRVSQSASVLSPTTQLRWTLPGEPGRQLRLAASRTYKAPTARELIPRRWLVSDNSATLPNFQGNPALQPELAWGVDLGYEQDNGANGFLGANLYGRWIEHLIRPQVSRVDGLWVSSPVNAGAAQVLGLELEARRPLRALWAAGPELELRGALAFNASKVAQVPGPANTLNQQARASLNLGADWRPADSTLAAGGSWVMEQGGLAQLSANQTTSAANKRLLDLYVQWALDKNTRLRLAGANLLAAPEDVRSTWTDDSLWQTQWLRVPSHRQWRLSLELKL